MRATTRFLKSASSRFSMAVLCVVFSGSWLYPNVAWSEAMLIKKSPARPTVYLGSMTSNQFPSAQRRECAPENFACAKQNNNPGPVPDALKSSYVNKLRAKGVIVVMEKPSHGTFDEVSVSMDIIELPSSPPIVPKRFVCDVNGGIIRHGTDGERKLMKVLETHKTKLEPVNESSSSLVRSCLESAASTVRQGMDAINHPKSKKDK